MPRADVLQVFIELRFNVQLDAKIGEVLPTFLVDLLVLPSTEKGSALIDLIVCFVSRTKTSYKANQYDFSNLFSVIDIVSFGFISDLLFC